MSALMDKVEFRAALEDAIKGREAKNAAFSQAWAEGLLQRQHFARWAENHFHYVGPFADYLAYIYSNSPDQYTKPRTSCCRTCTRRSWRTSATPTC